ncbi:hypothetical protein HF394_19620 (plasmid) [Planococcus glaciei]|uniref:Uncharacterized protein n=1 Tax=Planococcus glaciei TaxID=459472 RepID=A0A7H8QFV3_9BACL|nr:hypothetical protein [Planococcus glaciei]QKX52840.1 hypothetical protein HF394_19620 [Planococcus glaciei]
MSIVKTIQEKINHLKKDEEKMYVGIQFEKQLNERVKELEILEQEIDKVLKAK